MPLMPKAGTSRLPETWRELTDNLVAQNFVSAFFCYLFRFFFEDDTPVKCIYTNQSSRPRMLKSYARIFKGDSPLEQRRILFLAGVFTLGLNILHPSGWCFAKVFGLRTAH